jgi:NAD(P)-dependent dehydrogenase (short-subunit alcohol dehydrogenase family)
VSLSRTFAFEGSNVTVHAIHPGWIPTAMSSFTGPDDMDKQTSLMIDTIEKLGPDESGCFVKANGQDFPW